MHVKHINNQLIIVALLLSALSGCATTRVTNVAMPAESEVKPYTQLQYVKENDDLKMFVSFSGGGTRAAAFSYGVLEALRDTPITINNKKNQLVR